MENEKDLLSYLSTDVQNAKTGCAQLIQICEDAQFRKKLLEILEGYEKFYGRIVALCPCENKGETSETMEDLQRLAQKAMAKLGTLTDKSPKKMCEMSIKSLEGSIEKLTHKLDTATNEDPKVLALANEYRRFLSETMEEFKTY